MMLTPAKYEVSPPERANIIAAVTALAGFIIGLWMTFKVLPPSGWYSDKTVAATPAWLFAAWTNAFENSLMQQADVIPGLKFVSAAIDATILPITSHQLLLPLCSHFTIALLTSFVAGFVVRAYVLRETPVVDTREHVDGLRLVRGQDAIDHASALTARESGTPGSGFRLAPGVMMSKLRELRGVLLLGAPGSGKTRIILYLIESILEIMRGRPRGSVRLLIYDTTGEITATLPLEASSFALMHGHKPGGYAWAIGRDVRTVEDAEAIAAIFAPESKESMWAEGSLTIIAGCLVLCQAAHGTAWGADEFYDALLTDPIALRDRLEQAYPPAAKLIEIDPETGGLSKTTVSFFLSFRASVLRQMRPLALHWKEQDPSQRLSFIDWLEGRPGTPDIVVVQRSGKYPELSASWIGAVVDTISAHASDESFQNSQSRRAFLCLDELASLKRLRRFPDLLDVGRNKGIGVVAALQEIEQLSSVFGTDLAVSMLKRFRTKIICQQNQDEATDKLSKALIGTRSVYIEQTSETTSSGREGVSTSKSRTKQITDVPIVRGERLAYDLGVYGSTVKALVVGFGNIMELHWPVTVWPKRTDR